MQAIVPRLQSDRLRAGRSYVATLRRRRAQAIAVIANVIAASTATSHGSGDPAALRSTAAGHGDGAGSSSSAPASPAAGMRSEPPALDRLIRLTAWLGSTEASPGVPGLAVSWPLAHGMSSQYWLTALTVGLAHGAGAPAPAGEAARPCASSATEPLTRQASRCLPVGEMRYLSLQAKRRRC